MCNFVGGEEWPERERRRRGPESSKRKILIELSLEVVKRRGWPGRKAMFTTCEVALDSRVCIFLLLFKSKILMRPVGLEEAIWGRPSVRNDNVCTGCG